MAFQAVPNVAQLRLEGVVDGQQTINDLYFAISGTGITPTNLTVITLAVSNWWQASVIPLLSNAFQAVRVMGIDLTTQTGYIYDQPATTVGGVVGEAAPNNVAACVSLRSASRGRSFRGRNYVPAIPNISINLNTLDPEFIASLLEAYNLLPGAGTFEPGWEQVIVSRQTAGALRPTGLAIPVINATMVGNSVRSMRSREIGHGS